MLKYLAFGAICSLYILNIILCENVDKPLPLYCLGCLCKAASNCDAVTPCNENDGMTVGCGAYRIKYDFWVDSDRPTYNDYKPEDNVSYAKCTTNVYCSMYTVQTYMRKYKRDCNGDGKIDCDDAGALLVLGADRCNETWPKDFEKRFYNCKAILMIQSN